MKNKTEYKRKSLNFAFTLAEILITLVLLGIIATIILPVAVKSIPTTDVLKFKKGNSTLYSTINQLIKSEKYYSNGDLGINANGNLVSAPKYFCQTFAKITKSKSYSCKETGGTVGPTAYLSLAPNKDIVVNGTTTNTFTFIDCICASNKPTSSEITLHDGISYYFVNSKVPFGYKSGNYRIFSNDISDRKYKYICMQIDGSSEGPFGYAVRQDGKIIPGARAQAWNDKKIQNDATTVAQPSTTICSISYSSTPTESIDCGANHVLDANGNCKWVCDCTKNNCAECNRDCSACKTCYTGYSLSGGECR